jgi:GNAT superfamily N-acetyltransferase
MNAPREPMLRAAVPADAARIAQLLSDEGYPTGPSDVVDRLARFGGEDGGVVVADADGEVIGFVAVHRIPRFEHDDHVLRILALVVDAGVRERGIGRLLAEEAERLARSGGSAFVETTAGHHRADARHLFESLGFEAGLTTYLRKRL